MPLAVESSYDILRDFHNCSTINGGFNVAGLSTTVGMSTLYIYYGNNGPCSVVYGPLASPITTSSLLQTDTLSVGGAVYFRLGEPGCSISSECTVPPLTDGICNSEIGESAEITLGLFDISVRDPDGIANTQLMYSIVMGNEDNHFSVDSSRGNFSLLSSVDRDAGESEFTLLVLVNDGMFSGNFTIYIEVLDDNDNDPIPLVPIFTGSVDEELPIDTYALTAIFTDQDSGLNALLHYSIFPSSPDFSILDPNVGDITTGRVFDFENGDRVFNFTVSAQDISASPRIGTATILITISDINDNRPQIEVTPGQNYVEDFGPVTLGSVSVVDDDSNAYTMLYGIVTIADPLDHEFEVLDLPITVLPNGFKMGYHNFSLFIVGPGTPELYSTLLSNVTYENLAVLFELPLSRNITFGVCDMLINESLLSEFTPDTQRAFSSMATSTSLPATDAEFLFNACLEPAIDELTIYLTETNDRPVVLDFPVEFPPIPEDLPVEENQDSFVTDVFGDVIEDTDRDSVLGIAVIGHGGPAIGEIGIVSSNAECIALYNNIVTTGPTGCQGRNLDNFCGCPIPSVLTCVASARDVTFFCIDGANSNAHICTCPYPLQSAVQSSLPEFSEITSLEIDHGTGNKDDITAALGHGVRLEYDFSSTEERFNFTYSISTLLVTLQNGNLSMVSISPFIITYETVGSVSEESAVVLGPYNLIRWIPRPDQNGRAYLTIKGWDTTNGIAYGTRGVDTTLSTGDTSFSLDSVNGSITITAINDPPIILLGGNEVNYSTTYTESGPSIFVSNPNATIIELDAEDLFLSNLIVSISGIGGRCDLPDFGVSNDRLSYLNTTLVPLDEITLERSGQACIRYSFLGTMSVFNWQTFITMIRFSISDEEPSDHTRELAFVISDRLSTSVPAYVSIDVDLVSDICPDVSLASSGPVNYREHDPPVLLDTLLNVTDADRNSLIASANVQIMATPNDPCSTCVLRVPSNFTLGITAVFDQSTLTLTLTGPASPQAYQDLLRMVTFMDVGDEPSFNLVAVRFTVMDPILTTCDRAMADIGVMIEHINDNSPIIFLNYPISQDYLVMYIEGTGTVHVTGMMVNIIDVDGIESDTYRVRIAIESNCEPSEDRLVFPTNGGSNIVSQYNESTCDLTVEGASSVLEEDLSGLLYQNIDNDNPSLTNRSIVFTVMDDTLDPTLSQSVIIIVTENDRPLIDLDVANPVSSDAFQLLTTEFVSITGPSGGSITDPDGDFLVGMTLVLTEIDTAGNPLMERTDQAFEVLELTPPTTLDQFGLSGTFIPQSGQFIITGVSSPANFTTVLNSIVYSNSRLPPSDENNRRVVVSVSDGDLTSFATLTITFNVAANPPTLDLNGEDSGTDVEATYTLTNPPLPLFQTAFLMDIDGDHICMVNISMVGPDSTCLPTNIDFTNAYSDIIITTTDTTNGADYTISSRFYDCREAIVIEDVLRGIQFSSPDTASPGTCTLIVFATENRGLVSNTATARVEVRAFNAPPFIDLDLGLSGRDYSTVYFQGGLTQHIVSIFDAATARNITDMTVVGEAMDMAAEAPAVIDGSRDSTADDGTLFHGVVILEESNAGYVLQDIDSPTLSYLQVEFFSGIDVEHDVISFPCEASIPIPSYGCNLTSSAPLTFTASTCNNSVFDACNLPNSQDICSDMQVTIFCETVGKKAYRFEYLNNPLTSRYAALLGLIGYDYLLTTGGQINSIRLINITVFDPFSETVNPLAITRIRIRNQDVLIINVSTPSFIVYEDERPRRTCNLYTVRVRRLDGTVPSPSELVLNISQGNIGMVFGITEDGVIFLNNSVDRETISRYNLTITARIRTADIDTTASAQLTASVIDVNDNHPITADSYTVNVTEGMAGAKVVQVVATDADEGVNAELSYLLLGIGSEKFMVDRNGLVTTRVALNKTLEDYYLLVMIIMDRGEIYLSTHTVINVIVITPPPTQLEFNPLPFILVLENSAIGTNLPTPLSAFEVGGLDSDIFIRYQFIEIISGSTGLNENPDPFTVNPVTGVITVNSNLDSERTSNYSAVVEAFSVRALFPPMPAFMNITIYIVDENEFVPMFVGSPYSLSIEENTPLSTTITTFMATDNDQMNLGLIYSLSSDVPSTLPFRVEADGDLVVVGDLDFEDTDFYTFGIVVTDNPTMNMSPLQATGRVNVSILDINDNQPVFTNTPYNVSVLETALEGSTVLVFSSVDRDSPENSRVQYSTEDLDGTPFCLSTGDMSIEVCNSTLLTSIESNVVFRIVLTATNLPGQGSNITQVTTEPVTIFLDLVNEFDPQVTTNNITHMGYHEEDCGRGIEATCVGVLVFDFSNVSSDSDGGAGGELVYLLLTPNVNFTLSQETGELVINGRIDREEEDLYFLHILIIDGGDSNGNVRSTPVFITIPIYDIDDNPPVILGPTIFNVTEAMTATGLVFGQVNVFDPDINGTTTYQIITFSDPPRPSGCLISPLDPIYLPIFLDRITGQLSFCDEIDFEDSSNNVFTFTVSVIDMGQLSLNERVTHEDRREITVNVVDSNDNPPSFPGQNLDYSIYENEDIGAFVGSVRAEDIDSGINGLLEFSVVNGSTVANCSDKVPFYAVKTSDTTADILQCQALDYERQSFYSFTILVSDSGAFPMSSTTPASVTIQDRNDNSPIFESGQYTMNIFETDFSLLMSAVLRVFVTDQDSPPNSESTFNVISPQPSPFGLRAANTSSVELFVANPEMINFESGITSYEVVVQAINAPADTSDVIQFANTTVIVTILDVNDNAPIIFQPFTFHVRENQPIGTDVDRIHARDSDTGASAQLNYFIGSPSFSSGQGSENGSCDSAVPFVINSTTGIIATCLPLDYEATMTYSFLIVVCDSTEPPMCSDRNFTVNVIDLNDNFPVYDEDPFIANINENSPNGTRVDLITSTDADSAVNSMITYSVLTSESPFAIIRDEVVFTGESMDLDFEGPNRTYVISIRGRNPPFFVDDETHIVDVNLVINVTDRNDQPPIFPSQMDYVEISEHSIVGTVIYQLSTTDSDTPPNSEVTYSIIDANSPFIIEGINVVVQNSTTIDFDPPSNVRNYRLNIRATNLPAVADDLTQTADFLLSIGVNDTNDNFPVCTGSTSFMIREDDPINMGLVRITAEDIDSDNDIMYYTSDTLMGDPLCSEKDPFRIDPDSGSISICTPFDYERRTSYKVNFTVCDNGRPTQLCSNCPIDINIIDVNDNTPIVNETRFSVSELAPLNTIIGCVEAEDLDSGQNALLEYRIADSVNECSFDSPFAINESSGCISVCHLLDYERLQSYFFEIVVSDQGSPRLSNATNFTVIVVNENDHSPVFTSNSSASVLEEAVNAFVTKVTTQDNDSSPFNTSFFSLLDNAEGSFDIDNITGVVTTLRALDREQQETYTIVIQVSDGLNTNNQTVIVTLLDINDNQPEYQGENVLTFEEESFFETVLAFRDNDTGINANLIYSVNDLRFQVENNGVLRNLQELDRDSLTGPEIDIVVVASDLSNEPLETSVFITIILLDINDNAPQLSNITANIVDGSRIGTVVQIARGEDADEGTNALLRYSLGSPSDIFAINETSGEISLIQDIFITSSSAERLEVTINVSDSGVPSLSDSTIAVFFLVSSRPRFLEVNYSFIIPENSLGVVIGMVSAMDRDINQFNDVFIYSILSVSPYDAGFTITSNGTNGTLLSPVSYLDFEDAQIFNITLGVGRVNMTEVIDDTATVLLTLTETNDNVPHLSPMDISAMLREDAPVGTAFAKAVAIDFDVGPSGRISYNLSGDGAKLFSFMPNGDLVLSTGPVDFENISSYQLIYQACDNGTTLVLCSEPGSIFIEILDVDDLPPVFFPTNYSTSIREGHGLQTLVLSFNVTDEDTPLQNLGLSLVPPQTSFQAVLDSNAIVLMTTNVPLDRETEDFYQFEIIVTDPSLSQGSANVMIHILDDNDERPIVEPISGHIVEFLEEGPPVFLGVDLTIVDRDTLSLFPLIAANVSLRPTLGSAHGYPNPGGICDHANYSFLYDNNSHSLCGQDGCLYLIREGELDLREGSTLENGILQIPGIQDTARNPVHIFEGRQFENFTITIWVQFPAPTRGNIFEVQSAGANVFEMMVETDGSLGVLIRTSPTTSRTLLSSKGLDTLDGEWHQIAFTRNGSTLAIYFDCEEVASSEDNGDDINTNFNTGTFFIGFGLGGVFVSEFYFCSSVVVSTSHICCTLSCGEFIDLSILTPEVNVILDARTRSLQMIYNGTNSTASLSILEEALATITYQNLVSEPHPLDRGLHVQAFDEEGTSEIPTIISLRPILINDQRPLLDLNGTTHPGINFTTSSDETSTSTPIIGADALLSDRESGFWPIASVRVELLEVRGHILQVPQATPSGLGFELSNEDRTLEIVPIDEAIPHYPEEFIAFLHLVRYVNREEEQLLFDVSIQFYVQDDVGVFNDPISNTSITVVPTNDRPILDLNTMDDSSVNSEVAFIESIGHVNILTGVDQSITDSDSMLLSEARISFTFRPDGERESLRIDPQFNDDITSSFDPTNGILTITEVTDFSSWLTILRNVEYVNEEQNPSDISFRQVMIVVDDDGGASSEAVYVDITLTVENDPPELYIGGPNSRDFTVSFVEDGPCVPLVSPNLRLIDVDSEFIQMVRIILGGENVNMNFERIDYNGTPPNGFIFFPTRGRGLIILNPSRPSDYEVVIRNLIYCNTEDEPNEEGGRTVEFTVFDTGLITTGGTNIRPVPSLPSTSFITIIRMNDRPAVFFSQLDDISIRNTPTPIINSSSIRIDDSDDTLFDLLRIYITNPQDGSDNEIIEFSRQLPESSISRGPTDLPGPQILYTVTFTGGADVDRVTETISQLRYNNRAPDVTVEPPREVCVDLRDFKIFSLLTCVNVTISPPNNFRPIFDPDTITSYQISELSDPIFIATVEATDADIGREGTVIYSIDQVLSTNFRNSLSFTTDIFSIGEESGELTASRGLDAEAFIMHNITVLASDQGNPVGEARISIVVTILDINDEPPIFTGPIPYVAVPQREELDPPNVIFLVTAIDTDVTSPNNRISRYGLENFQDRFRISAQSGVIEHYALLDADLLQTYVLNVSATDSGSPPLISYTTVSFTLIDSNDNPAVVDQIAPAVYTINSGSSPIGPAIRIIDADLDPPAISTVRIVLTPSSADLSLTYDQCLVQCQNARLEEAGLSPPAIDLLGLATFSSVGSTNSTIGGANCPAVTIARGTTIATDGFGVIQRNFLPPNFATGEYSISFVLTQMSEGFVLLIPDQTNTNLPPGDVEREFGLWIRRRDFRFYYVTGDSRFQTFARFQLNSATSITEFFDPSNPQTRHFTFVVSPPFITLYVDCMELATETLVGDIVAPLANINVFIGGSRPHPLNGGRLAGQIHGLFYHPMALTVTQITDFCSCGFEALVLPELPDTIQTVDAETTAHSIHLEGTSGLIPNDDILSVLRSINYTNQFDSPTVDPNDPTRTIDFTITEETGIIGSRTGSIRLVASDNTFPVVDLNGFITPGTNVSTTFVEDGDPVLVSPNAEISRDIEGFINPTFSQVRVSLINARDVGEILNATATEVISVTATNNGQTLYIEGPGIPREFNEVLQALRYANLNDNPTTSVQRRIEYHAVDTEGRTNPILAVSTVTLTSLNDAPQLSLVMDTSILAGVVRFEEGSEGIQIAPNITVLDLDNEDLMSATISLTSPMLSTDTLIAFSNSDDIITNYDRSTGVLNLNGRASLSQYQALIASIVFVSTDSPFLDAAIESLTRTVTIQVSDGQLSSDVAIVQVEFMPNNDAPVVNLTNMIVTFRDGDMQVPIAASADISDSDNRQLMRMTVELEGTLDNNILSYGTQSSRLLAFGQGSIAEFVSILRSIQYINLAEEPSLLSRIINIVVCDFIACTNAQVTVRIEDRNDNHPMFTRSTYAFTIRENSETGSTVGTLRVTDADVETTVFTFTEEEPFFTLVPEGSSVHILTNTSLNFEETELYSFTITANDGVNNGHTQVEITVDDINEAPALTFNPANPALVIGPNSQNMLIEVEFQVADPDFNDTIPTALFTLRNVPAGSDESLVWEEVMNYTFQEIQSKVYQLSGPGDVFSLRQALSQVLYVAGDIILEPTTIRTVAIVVTDASNVDSEEAVITVSLASIPQFSQVEYQLSLTEESTAFNFLQVLATVESGGDVITYEVEDGRGLIINSSSGFLSLVEAVDREESTSLVFSVFAIDALPPARTGTTTVNITILDLNDVRPSVSGLMNITVTTAQPLFPFNSIEVTDPDTIGAILVSTISIFGSQPLEPLPFTQKLCVDERNIVDKVTLVCGGLEDGIVLLESINRGVFSDSDGNDILNLNGSDYAMVETDFRNFTGLIEAFTFIFWVRAETSGYIVYFGTPDSIERYFALFFSKDNNQLIVTVKREGLAGLIAQIRISFQLTSSLTDGDYHLIMLQYSENNMICVVDGELAESVAVIYKNDPFNRQVFGKLYS